MMQSSHDSPLASTLSRPAAPSYYPIEMQLAIVPSAYTIHHYTIHQRTIPYASVPSTSVPSAHVAIASPAAIDYHLAGGDSCGTPTTHDPTGGGGKLDSYILLHAVTRS